jgi:hypothetical protein
MFAILKDHECGVKGNTTLYGAFSNGGLVFALISQVVAVHLQPGFRFTEPGTDGLETAPESNGVIHVFQMIEFVQNNVVTMLGRNLDQAPI